MREPNHTLKWGHLDVLPTSKGICFDAWVLSHVNESCHIWRSHVAYENELVTYERVLPHKNESCQRWRSPVTYERVMHQPGMWRDWCTDSVTWLMHQQTWHIHHLPGIRYDFIVSFAKEPYKRDLDSCGTYESTRDVHRPGMWEVKSRIWMSHVTHMDESCHAYEWVMSHTKESCHTHEWVMSHMKQSCHTHE